MKSNDKTYKVKICRNILVKIIRVKSLNLRKNPRGKKLRVSEYQDAILSHHALGHRKPILFFALWVVFELGTSLVPSYVSDSIYDTIYFLSEDWSTIALSLAFYFALSYTSTILKAISVSAVIISTMLFATNMLVEYTPIPESSETSIVISGSLISLILFLLRFLFKIRNGGFMTPEHDHIYLVVSKPRDLLGMVGLFYSGIGGGFSAYVNGDCYWFPRAEGRLVKTYEKDWYKGRYLIDCGPVTGDKINDLESMIGQKWSLMNNCISVFGRWRRKWG